MDEITRVASDITQLTKRVDDMTLRLALVENEQKYVDEKISDIKVLIIEKNNDLREDFGKEMKPINEFVAQQRALGFWLVTLIGGSLLLAVLNLILIRTT